MNWKFLTIFFTCLIFLGLVPSGLSNSEGINILIQSSGDVKVKRVKWKTFQKANIGALLSANDEIQLNNKASALLLCSNAKKWQARSGKVSAGCPREIATLTRKDTPRARTRSSNEAIPYIITPRNTNLLTNRPLIRWHSVAGTTRYIVRIEGSGLNWQTETKNTQIAYPGEPPLQPGKRYLVVVTTDKGASSEKEQGSLRFSLLATEKADLVRSEIAKIKQQKLGKEAEELALAYLYQSNDLIAEAIELLEELGKQKSQTIGVYQLLGNLYLQTGLNSETKNNYLRALELAQKFEDIEAQAQAQVGLGEANSGLGKTKEAKEWLEKAKANYLALGDDSQVEELQQRIATINQK